MQQLNDEVVLISGGFGRLGWQFAKAIIASGGRVCLFDIKENPEKISQSGIAPEKFYVHLGDVTKRNDIDLAIAACRERLGGLTSAVHCAYPTSPNWGAEFFEVKFESLREDLANQLGGAILFSQRVIHALREGGGGSLIHVSSILGVSPPKFWHYEGTSMTSPIEYGAIKAGVIAITKYLAKYCAKDGVRVNCISPGGIIDEQPSKFLRRYKKSCLSKGMLDGSDVAGVLVFLLSEGSKYISGQNIIVDDGWTL
jgi:NAD(P)-dependent dehydrogenase (short-subunit alcohol dehydrogenase family)